MLRAVSYNIHSGRDLFWRKRLVQMARTLKELNPDIIGIQEIHQNSKYGYQGRYLAEQLQYHLAFSPSIALADGHYGNALLTRLPLHGIETIELPAKREKRSLLQASLSWMGKEISVWITHCSLNRASRASQVKLLTSLASHQPDVPLLLLGDFNAPEISFAPLLADCAVLQGMEKYSTMPALRRRLDYIFASKHWKPTNYSLSPVTWSDHVPIMAELQLM